ncbi:probable sodium-coupled neutral amino acid transporter 6 [Papilio machaon]|uniref:probable sodium-coupled neutral amino acid transporter 6 n=1 Tax=Papilio machaon TaxID=76193 RepID=UPI001E665140|nr:probable sodium-coupled neutral amino acid transporter 6 [Papilio machaon]XP_045540493.1 probable sodium-coupled neutral amino acid transporter 6 [Papilio machaon]
MKIMRLFDSMRGSSAVGVRPTIHQGQYTAGETTGGLSVLFTMLCIVDLFGVFPVVALPKSVIACGLYGIPLVIAVFSLQLYTAVLLGKSWLLAYELSPNIREKSRFPYAAVAELAFGDNARRLVTFFIDATVFGAAVPNFIFASQSLQLFWWKISGGSVGVTYCVWMVVIGLLLCPIMWLGSPKDMKSLALTSVCIVGTVAVATWYCILTDDESPSSLGGVLDYTPEIGDFLTAYGIIAFQFDIHPMLLTLQVDMKDSRRINAAVLAAFLTTGLVFLITTVLAANRYGDSVESNILQGIPPSITLYIVALLVTLQLCLSSAVGNSALFQHLEDLLKIPRNFCIQRCLMRSSIVALAVFLGESVPRFDLVMGLVGSTLTGPLMFIFPPLFFLKLCYLKSINIKQEFSMSYKPKVSVSERNASLQDGVDLSKLPLVSNESLPNKYQTFGSYEEIYRAYIDEYNVKWYDVLLAFLVMLLGMTATVVATYSSWSDAISSATFSPPCLLNASAAARSFIQDTS